MPSINIKYGSGEYKVDYEYNASQKGDAETESLPESFEPTAIYELLSDDSYSDDLIGDFSQRELIEVSNIIRNEVKHSY